MSYLTFREARIDLNDLPANMTVSEIQSYLTKIHPDTYINIFCNTMTILQNIPTELLCKIFLSDRQLRVSALSTCKTINEHMIKGFYELECDRDISIKEIQRRLNEDCNGYDENAIFTKSIPPEWITIYNSRENENVSISINLFNNLAGVYNTTACCFGIAQRIQEFLDEKFGDFELTDDTYSDILSRYRSRCDRISLMKYNPMYAKNYLIKEYNTLINNDTINELSSNNIMKIIIASYVAYVIEPALFKKKSDMNEDHICSIQPLHSINIRNKLDYQQLICRFYIYCDIIREYVSIMTDTKL